jgi:predicted GIY-YIG superfamily endonuclease
MKARYRRMLEGMQAKAAKKRRRKKTDPWFVYILECSDGSFYTGITNDIDRRLKAHNDGKASRYTRTRLPVTLVYQETCSDRTEALVRECKVKSLSRSAKEKLVRA